MSETIENDLIPVLQWSIEREQLRKDVKKRDELINMLRRENALLRVKLERHERPALLKPQAG